MSQVEKHKIKLLERDSKRNYVILEMDGEKVRIDKISNEKRKKWIELDKKGSVKRISISAGLIDFGTHDKKVFGLYRLLWYFGVPHGISDWNQYTCFFELKYKDFTFVLDDARDHLRINSEHDVPRDKYAEYSKPEKKAELAPPEEIKNEFRSLIDFLVKYPIEREVFPL